MNEHIYLPKFIEAARNVGAHVVELDNLGAVADYVAKTVKGQILLPDTLLTQKHDLRQRLIDSGVTVYEGKMREAGRFPAAGVTFCNFAMADTGTVVLDSTDEEVRLATTLPEIHFVIVDPEKILADNLAAVEPMTELHCGSGPRFVAYITGPSRTADIERVLTIGCHGPRELHILVIDSVSSDIKEM